MAKEKNNLDQFFREKLNQDSIKPSNLAWDRLESQLPRQEKSKTTVIWWSVATSVAALFVVGYFALTISFDPTLDPVLASSEENQIEEVIPQSEEIQTEISQELSAQPEEKSTIIKKTKPTNSISQKPASIQVNSPASTLIAVAEEMPDVQNPDRKVELTPLMDDLELPTLALTNFQVNQTVAEVIEKPEVEEPAYRVKIYSDGIKEDKSLIEGISKKVDQVGGLIGKVDQGFADLQDAKNNFFTALITKKEKVAEKP
jgi:hypothetical protein